MAYTGTWKRSGAENAGAIMKHIGMPQEMMDAAKEIVATLEIKQDGDTIEEVYTMGPKSHKTVLKLGKESELTAWNDDKVKTIPTSVGPNKMKAEYDHKGVHYCGVRELTSPTEFVDHIDLDNGKVVGKFIYTKC